jgi:hypothetical protein
MLVDENHFNHILLNLFETEEVFSLTEQLFAMWPEDWMGGPTIIRGIMSVQIWQVLFHNLIKAYTPTQKVDFRCGLGKKFISQDLKDNSVS